MTWMNIRVGEATAKGPRDENQDTSFVSKSMIIVSDGMGGHRCGKRASELAVSIVKRILLEDPSVAGLKRSMVDADRETHKTGAANPECLGMGSTLTVGLVIDEELFVANVGDSRCTLINNDGLHQVTFDHNIPGELVRCGRLSREKAKKHPSGNVLTRSIGAMQLLTDIDVFRVNMRPGQVFLFTSDGLHDFLEDEDIVAAVQANRSPDKLACALVDMAIEAGTTDNATCAVLSVTKARTMTKKRDSS